MSQKQAINEELSQIKAIKEVIELAEEERSRRSSLDHIEALQKELTEKGFIEKPASVCGAVRRKSLTQSVALQDELKAIAIKAGMSEKDAEVYRYEA